MFKKTTLLTICITFLVSSLALSEGNKTQAPVPTDSDTQQSLPAYNQEFAYAKEGMVDLKNEINNDINTDIAIDPDEIESEVCYDESGRIDYVRYSSGDILKYEYNEKGNLIACALHESSDDANRSFDGITGIKFVFVEVEKPQAKSGDENPTGRENPAIRLTEKERDFMSATPIDEIDFNRIKEKVENFQEEQLAQYEKFDKNVAQDYKEAFEGLKTLKPEFVLLNLKNMDFDLNSKEGVSVEYAEKIVNDYIKSINSDPRETAGLSPTVKEAISNIKTCKDNYFKELENSENDVTKILQEIINRKLVFYANIPQGKGAEFLLNPCGSKLGESKEE